MLKIKDNVDLKELEKFGFKRCKVCGEDALVYDFIPYTLRQSSYLVMPIKSRNLVFSYVDFILNAIECFDLIFELINKADMVEKVVEDE